MVGQIGTAKQLLARYMSLANTMFRRRHLRLRYHPERRTQGGIRLNLRISDQASHHWGKEELSKELLFLPQVLSELDLFCANFRNGDFKIYQ